MARYSRIFDNTVSTDINDMQFAYTPNASVTIKTAAATIVNTSSSSFNAPWDDAFGAYASTTIVDTWATIVDVTGGGYLGSVISTATRNASDVANLRVTLDGSEYEITFTAPTAIDSRIVLGGYPVQNNTTIGSPGAASGIFDYYNHGISVASYPTSTEGIAASRYTALVPVSNLMTEGSPVIRFNSSLKVEAKSNPFYTGQSAISFVDYELDSMWVT